MMLQSIDTPEKTEATVLSTDVPSLELARRIDWRFLLPHPELAEVALVGAADSQLRCALSRFSRSFTHLAGPDSRADDGSVWDLETDGYRLVVVCEAGEANLSYAASLVRPGGVLYCEVNRRSLSAYVRWPHPGRYREALAELGFRDVQLHWHWPDFTQCTMMIPLQDRAAVRLALERSGADRTGRLRAVAGRLALTAGLLPWLVPSLSLLARREDPP